MFATIEAAPPDPILGLTEAFKADSRPNKINLGVGVYLDETGKTPLLDTVRQAEQRMAAAATNKSYLPIDGDAAYNRCVRQLLFGSDHSLVKNGQALTAQTPGGTGALRVAADYLHACHPTATLWLSNPTWANHDAIFHAADVPTAVYAYFNPKTNSLDFDALIAALHEIPHHDVILLHACCHNPSGVDPTVAQWEQIADVLAQRQLLPLIDFAYQGFGDGLEEDAAGLRAVADRVPELLVCSSFSKNFSLYNERVGALTIVSGDKDSAANVMSQIKVVIRRNYSNPPAHGAAIVRTILTDDKLRAQWLSELTTMRNRINAMRRLFVDTLAKLAPGRDFSFIVDQRGMFSFSGLNKDQVKLLRDEHAIYIVGSGRINVAGMTPGSMDQLCKAIASVL
ncbi:MAG: aspartate/tyrosine/aromatic aminotransferase [Phycisphaeraceae bacterium]|nr:aspartate/tyrosine/aromatic aminotransferase [Phycisphaeraceae bacterium]